jgi:dTDP-4-dehydrorhamnose reductase
VYGPRASNFYQLIARKAAAGEPMRMVDDQTSVPTPSSFVAKYTPLLLGHEGLLHLVPSGQATRYEFACEVVRAMRSGSTVERARTADFPAPARRPAYSAMANAKATIALGETLPDWRATLHDCMKLWTPA